jgi:hypothetical protein
LCRTVASTHTAACWAFVRGLLAAVGVDAVFRDAVFFYFFLFFIFFCSRHNSIFFIFCSRINCLFC